MNIITYEMRTSLEYCCLRSLFKSIHAIDGYIYCTLIALLCTTKERFQWDTSINIPNNHSYLSMSSLILYEILNLILY